MIPFLLILNTTVFIILSLLHVYWACGGQWALKYVGPQKADDGEDAFRPGTFMTLLVAVGLLLFALTNIFHLTRLSPITDVPRYMLLVISIIFFIRVIGDFNYVGITKKVRNTVFARYDNRLYIPICAYLSFSHLLCFLQQPGS